MFYKASPLIFLKAKELRNNVTEAEMILWGHLKTNFPFYRFRRQHPIADYIADFYCHPVKLIIEVDGKVHEREDVKQVDAERQKHLESCGIKVLRFTNEQIHQKIESVIERINTEIVARQKNS